MKLVSAALFALLFPSISSAQNGVFVQGGPLVDFRFTPVASGDPTILGLPTPTFEWSDFNRDGLWQPGEEGAISFPSHQLRQVATERAAPGATVAIGTFIAPSVSLSVEASFAGGHVTTVDADRNRNKRPSGRRQPPATLRSPPDGIKGNRAGPA